MKLVSSMKGSGISFGGLSAESEAHYSINVWRTPEGATFGHGEIVGMSPRGLAGFLTGRFSLILADGRTIDVTVGE